MKTLLMTALFSAFLFNTPTIYDLKANAIEEGKQINFSTYKGKKILIVNTACSSPYTFQIEGLQQLYSAYKEKLVVIAFPAGNDFGDQELKTNKQIQAFFRSSYGATFPVTELTTVKGDQRHPVFQYLIEEAKKIGVTDPIKWNFTKFLLDENGQLLKVFPADVTPLSPEITSFLNNKQPWSL
ncbi:MAG TPA: glutathione peroxidase [Flavisolibacter sp.]|nr:glutathione peroxidase [Flavisolibacter sp.]